jgi:hypothetical protein
VRRLMSRADGVRMLSGANASRAAERRPPAPQELEQGRKNHCAAAVGVARQESGVAGGPLWHPFLAECRRGRSAAEFRHLLVVESMVVDVPQGSLLGHAEVSSLTR